MILKAIFRCFCARFVARTNADESVKGGSDADHREGTLASYRNEASSAKSDPSCTGSAGEGTFCKRELTPGFADQPTSLEHSNGTVPSSTESCRVALRAVPLTRRQCEMAELLLDLPVDYSGSISFRRLDDVAVMMGTKRAHVHGWLHDLSRYGIIVIEQRGRRSGWRLKFRPEPGSWSITQHSTVRQVLDDRADCVKAPRLAPTGNEHNRPDKATEPQIDDASFRGSTTHGRQQSVTESVPVRDIAAGTDSSPSANDGRNQDGNTTSPRTRAKAKLRSQADQLLSPNPSSGNDLQIKTPPSRFDPAAYERLLVALRALMGPDWPAYQKLWQGRARKFPRAVEEALAEAKVRREHPTLPPVVKPGGWLNDEFRRILGEAPRPRSLRETRATASIADRDIKNMSREVVQSPPAPVLPVTDTKPVMSEGGESLSNRLDLHGNFGTLKKLLKGGPPTDPSSVVGTTAKD